MCSDGDNTQASVDAWVAAAGFAALPPGAAVVVRDADGAIIAASAEAHALLGLSIDELLGRTDHDLRWAAVDEWGNFLEDAQNPALMARLTGVAVRDGVMGVYLPGSDAPGRHVWLHLDAIPVFQNCERILSAVVVIFSKVDGERLQALKLRESEQLFRMIAEHSSDMVAWQLVPRATFVWVSPAARTVLGYDPDVLIGTDGIDLVHPDDMAPLTELWRAATDVLPTFTARMRHADGGYRWIETTAQVLSTRQHASRQMITTHRDVTDRVVAERARDAAVRILELAIQHATIGAGLRTMDEVLIRVNPAMCTILGRSADELIGHSLREFAVDDGVAWADAVAAVHAGALSHYESERYFLRPDGTAVCCLDTVIALPDEHGVIAHCLVQLQDITQQKRAVAQLEQAALTDALTGLPNRAVLETRLNYALSQARQAEARVGVLFIDLDDFKRVNDTHGHEAGDDLLREAGRRLSAVVRHTDTIVRLGGDEFVVVREHLSDDDIGQLDSLAADIHDVLSEPFVVNGQPLTICASIGSAVGAELMADELLAQADEAMYRAKRYRAKGDGRYGARTHRTR